MSFGEVSTCVKALCQYSAIAFWLAWEGHGAYCSGREGIWMRLTSLPAAVNEFGVGLGRLAGGGSAGGHVAACTGVVPGFEADDEDAHNDN